MTTQQDDVPPGMIPAPPRFDSEGRPICQLCGDLLVPDVRKGGNWAQANRKAGAHLCNRHHAAKLYNLKRKQREQAKKPTTGRKWIPLMEFDRIRRERAEKKQARREVMAHTGLPFVDHG